MIRRAGLAITGLILATAACSSDIEGSAQPTVPDPALPGGAQGSSSGLVQPPAVGELPPPTVASPPATPPAVAPPVDNGAASPVPPGGVPANNPPVAPSLPEAVSPPVGPEPPAPEMTPPSGEMTPPSGEMTPPSGEMTPPMEPPSPGKEEQGVPMGEPPAEEMPEPEGMDPVEEMEPEPPPPPAEMPRPAVRVPNVAYPDKSVGDEITPTMSKAHHNQPAMLNGYLMLSGNAVHETWDISDPGNPKKLADMKSEHRNGEAESHQMAFARYGDKFYATTISGKGFDIWDVTDMKSPSHVSHVSIDGINYGDVAGGVWGLAWQGKYIYAGGNNTGLHIVDVEDPANPTKLKTLKNSETGGFFPGPVFAMGNILVISSPKDKGGVATMDISNPEDPILLDSMGQSKSYIGWYYAGHVFLQGPLRVFDVLSDPTNINQVVKGMNTPGSEYLSFGDDQMFLGLLRPNPGVIRFDMTDMSAPERLEKIEGRNLGGNDDQFSLKVGNLIVLSDDQKVGGAYAGSYVVVESKEPDTVAPYVKNVWPRNEMSVLDTSSVGLSFSDQIELATVGTPSFIVRKVGGAPIAGKWGGMRTIVNFAPDEPFEPGEYEIVLPVGGISDLGGTPIAEEFKSTFTVL